VETPAKAENRTKSELFREMVRVYRRYCRQRDREETRWVTNLIAEAKAEQAKNPMTADELLAENESDCPLGRPESQEPRHRAQRCRSHHP
jgi:hypothetical protein